MDDCGARGIEWRLLTWSFTACLLMTRTRRSWSWCEWLWRWRWWWQDGDGAQTSCWQQSLVDPVIVVVSSAGLLLYLPIEHMVVVAASVERWSKEQYIFTNVHTILCTITEDGHSQRRVNAMNGEMSMRDDCGVGRRAWRRREQCGSHGGDGCSLLLLFKSGGGGKFTVQLCTIWPFM